MPMSSEDYEALLEELLNPELEHSRKSEILQTLRTDYNTVRTEHEEHSNSIQRLQSEKDDLVVSNSKLFRQLGVVGQGEEKTKQEEQKSFSESVRIEDFEKSF